LGLIGCGHVTETQHLPALRSLRDAKVIAVADKFHVEKRYDDFRDLLSDPAVEAVAICVPLRYHGAMALAALDAGKHMFIEKPLTLSLDEADQLIERAAQSPCKVMVGFNKRWHRLVRRAREMIQRGALGPLELVVTVFTTRSRYRHNVPEWRKRRELGGVLIDIAIHHYDVWRFLLQDEVEEVFATSRSEEWDDLTATVTARMAHGVLITSAVSESTNERNEIQIYGQVGSLHVSLYRFDSLEFAPLGSLPGDIRTRLQNMAHFLKELPQAITNIRRGGDYNASFRAQRRHFIDAIQQDTSPECTLEGGRKALQIALAAVESASVGLP
jgi:myo-inositol 2-dehydrogenase/D-chiro-inositol 1-dehydrogenase